MCVCAAQYGLDVVCFALLQAGAAMTRNRSISMYVMCVYIYMYILFTCIHIFIYLYCVNVCIEVYTYL